MDALVTLVTMHLPPSSMQIFTETSLYRLSGWLLYEEVYGSWGLEVQFHPVHWNWKELKAIQLTVLHFSEFNGSFCQDFFRQLYGVGLSTPLGFCQFLIALGAFEKYFGTHLKPCHCSPPCTLN